MRILNLTEVSEIYTSNVFLVRGSFNAINDVNTLVDVGRDERIIKKIENINTGLGKKKIDQVILTHSHSDHMGLLPLIRKTFNPKVYAFNSQLKGVDYGLRDGDNVKLGDMNFEVFHITVHSNDSICLFCEQTGELFAGDTVFPVSASNLMGDENNKAILRLNTKNITKVYYGHGAIQSSDNRRIMIIE